MIGGNILATICSSVGPVHCAAFGYGADFAPLMGTLRRVSEISPAWALGLQDMLPDGRCARSEAPRRTYPATTSCKRAT